MGLSVLVAIYVFLTVYAFLKLGLIVGLASIAFGIVIAFLVPTFRKMQKQNVRRLIEKGLNASFINVNTAPYYILEELPSIERTMAKRIVYIRMRYGKYKSLEDFFEKLNIAEQEQEKLRKFLKV